MQVKRNGLGEFFAALPAHLRALLLPPAAENGRYGFGPADTSR
jgi:hypothetical protein